MHLIFLEFVSVPDIYAMINVCLINSYILRKLSSIVLKMGMILHHSGAYCSVLGIFLVVLRGKKASGAKVVKLH